MGIRKIKLPKEMGEMKIIKELKILLEADIRKETIVKPNMSREILLPMENFKKMRVINILPKYLILKTAQ